LHEVPEIVDESINFKVVVIIKVQLEASVTRIIEVNWRNSWGNYEWQL